MLKKSLTEDAQEVFRAIALIELGARMQVLESEFTLSRDRMIRLYREVKGVSPPKGMLPFSADWYMTWLANIHASLFYNTNTYTFLKNEAGCSHLDALTKGYRLYLEHCNHSGAEAVLDLTRAWTLVRFFDAGMLQMTPCCCTGKFVAHKHDLQNNVVCGACQPPSRAGKTKKAAAARQCQSRSRAGGNVEKRSAGARGAHGTRSRSGVTAATGGPGRTGCLGGSGAAVFRGPSARMVRTG
ncbi:Flagellar transcriptional activator FlhC [Candidatus Paraburkholderia schumanniana]|nr:Flagellar transcriptional activator FlhC [Candidatus Paraburkholderia schumannianae]